jgi:hypothetical protein
MPGLGNHYKVQWGETQSGEMVPLPAVDPTKTPAVERLGGRKNVVEKSANFSVTRYDSGGIFVITAVDKVASLPATAPGLTYTFVVSTPSATTGFSVSPVAADQIIGGGLTAADDKDVINTVAKTGTWARQA